MKSDQRTGLVFAFLLLTTLSVNHAPFVQAGVLGGSRGVLTELWRLLTLVGPTILSKLYDSVSTPNFSIEKLAREANDLGSGIIKICNSNVNGDIKIIQKNLLIPETLKALAPHLALNTITVFVVGFIALGWGVYSQRTLMQMTSNISDILKELDEFNVDISELKAKLASLNFLVDNIAERTSIFSRNLAPTSLGEIDLLLSKILEAGAEAAALYSTTGSLLLNLKKTIRRAENERSDSWFYSTVNFIGGTGSFAFLLIYGTLPIVTIPVGLGLSYLGAKFKMAEWEVKEHLSQLNDRVRATNEIRLQLGKLTDRVKVCQTDLQLLRLKVEEHFLIKNLALLASVLFWFWSVWFFLNKMMMRQHERNDAVQIPGSKTLFQDRKGQ